jgi:L-methionine (R)-S-oxide reductase
MAEELTIAIGSKEEKYQSLLPQIEALITGESDFIANLSNIMAALHHGMGFFWTGVYFVKDNELVLGPFQGPVACTRIAHGKGVCGTAWAEKTSIVVEDVDAFPGHIACSSDSKSEIVLPAFNPNNNASEVALILDVDSNELANFDEIDLIYLSKVVHLIEGLLCE